MENMRAHFSDTEIKKLLKENFMILYDTREQVNEHVLNEFDTMNVKYKKQKIDEGDYTAIITINIFIPFAFALISSLSSLISSRVSHFSAKLPASSSTEFLRSTPTGK